MKEEEERLEEEERRTFWLFCYFLQVLLVMKTLEIEWYIVKSLPLLRFYVLSYIASPHYPYL